MEIDMVLEDLIRSKYIDAIHYNQDRSIAMELFHDTFKLYIKTGNEVEAISLSQWFDRVERSINDDKFDPEVQTTCEFINIDVLDQMAYIKMKLFRNDTYFGTDMILLYFVNGLWKIVCKTFQTATKSLLQT